MTKQFPSEKNSSSENIVFGIITVASIIAFCYLMNLFSKAELADEAEEKELVEKAMGAGKKSYELILLKDKDFHYDYKKSDSLYEIEQARIIKSLYKN